MYLEELEDVANVEAELIAQNRVGTDGDRRVVEHLVHALLHPVRDGDG